MTDSNKRLITLKQEMINKIEIFRDKGIYKLSFKTSDTECVELTFDIKENTFNAINFKDLMREDYNRIDYVNCHK